jgi:ADP-ribose pyrophosphatase
MLADPVVVNSGHLPIEKRQYRLPSGATKEMKIVARTPVACSFALTPERQVVLVRQFRPRSGRILTELPAGFIDEGESPLKAARPELAEEIPLYRYPLTEAGQLYLLDCRH